ncbi:MAG: diguanylate cyclase [Pseudomonadota bacterium]
MAKSNKDIEEFAHLIVEHATDSMVFTDPDGLTVWANKPFAAMSGYEVHEVIGKKPGAMLQGPNTDQATVADIRAAIEARRTIRTELLNYTKFGDAYWIDLTITPVRNAKGELTHFMSIERDITEKKEMARRTSDALAEEQERKRERKLLSQMSEWLFSAQSQKELQAVVTRAMARLFPRTQGMLYIYSNSRDVLDLASDWGNPKRQPHLHADQCWALRRGRAYAFGTSEIDFVCDHVESEDNPYFCLPIIAHGDTIGLLHIIFPEITTERDLSHKIEEQLASSFEIAQICAEQISLAAANVRLQQDLQDKSVKDSLTGLWNRRWFTDMAGREMRRGTSAKTPLTLAMLDVDHFKKFNDAHGHDAGDTVLKILAALMLDIDKQSIYPCRIGGEEFAILFAGHEVGVALDIVGELRKALAESQIIHSGTVLPNVTISIGLAEFRADVDDLAGLMKRADEALYEAKARGRDCAVVCEAGPRVKREDRAKAIAAV